MICDKGIEMKFVLILLLGVFVWGDEGGRCIEREREALVSFKNGLIDGFGILSSWQSDECCNWYGVVCSNTTDGHVIRLELGALDFDGVLRGASNRHLVYLIFRRNEFYGTVPPGICHLTRVQVLDVSSNNLSGKIPDCFNNFTLLADTSPSPYIFGYRLQLFYNSHLPNPVADKVYRQHSLIQWKGQELEYRRNLILLRLIDFSSNRLSGTIPHSFSNMMGLISLNLSRNSLTGNIIPNIGQIEMLECLDLSHNQLSGEIPMSLSQLHFLSVLDLSDNSLSGKIPLGSQLQSFNISSYAGNDGLCGLPLPLCPGDSPRPITQEEEDDEFWRLSFMQGLAISICFGFIVGFWGAVGSLVLKKSWRYAYFKLLDDVGDWFYVRISLLLSKWRRS